MRNKIKFSLWLMLGLLCCLFPNLLTAAPLPAKQVFQVQVEKQDPNTFKIHWTLRKGYFLYADRIRILAQQPEALDIAKIPFPETQTKTDSLGHTYAVYRDTLTLPISVLAKYPGDDLLTLRYQGCSDDGFCYPPVETSVRLSFDTDLALTQAQLFDKKSVPAVSKENVQNTQNDQSRIERLFSLHHPLMVIFIFAGFGLLLTFTPCVLPMIPVLSGIIVGHGQALSTRKAFLLSLSYVLSMATTYAVIGGIAASLGSNLQVMMQSPLAIILMAGIFGILALSMFGLFDLKLPINWQAKFANASKHQARGRYLSAALMGCISTLVLSPCVTPPLVGALSYIAHTGNIGLGMIALFALGLGMGIPLLLIGASAGKLLPKAGHWMNMIKAFFGVLLLSVSIFLLGRLLSPQIVMVLWAILGVFCGVYAGALQHAQHAGEKFMQAVGILCLSYGLLLWVGVSMGNTNPLQPLAGLMVSAKAQEASQKEDTKMVTVNSLTQLRMALNRAQGQPVILDFYADWCTSCKVMEATVFQNPKIMQALQHYQVIKVDVTANDRASHDLLKKYTVVAPPTLLFLAADGRELEQERLVGELEQKVFLKKLMRMKGMLG